MVDRADDRGDDLARCRDATRTASSSAAAVARSRTAISTITPRSDLDPDGNKRAWVAMRLFLDINGWTWRATPDGRRGHLRHPAVGAIVSLLVAGAAVATGLVAVLTAS